MTSITFTGKGGQVYQVIKFGKQIYPAQFPIESLKNAFTFKARPDDILLCAYSRSGTHWTHEIVRFLLAGSTEIPHVTKEYRFLELESPPALEELPSPRYLNTHYHFDSLSPEFLRHKCKIIHMTRDPRDVMVSLYNQRLRLVSNHTGPWGDYFEMLLEGKVSYGSWFEYTKEWERGMKENPDHPFLVLSFEDMKRDPLKEVRRISEFLELKHDEDFLAEVVKKTGFDAMKARYTEVVKTSTDEKESRRSSHATVKGVVGDWKNWFTVAQSERFEEVFEREMPGTNAYTLYSLNR